MGLGLVSMSEQEAHKLLDSYLALFLPLEEEMSQKWYAYAVSGDKELSQQTTEAEFQLRKLHSDKKYFSEFRQFYEGRTNIRERKLRREIELAYLRYLPNQVDPTKLEKITILEGRLRELANDYRPTVEGKRLGPDEVSRILVENTDSLYLEKVWKEQTRVGEVLEEDYRQVVSLRNEIARDLGFSNFIELSAVATELDLKQINRFYDDLEKKTTQPFQKLKTKFLDPKLAKRYNIKTNELFPWHYQNQYFQDVPSAVFEKLHLDDVYKGKDSHVVVAKTSDFFASMGIDVASIIKRSSLFPKEGKNPHAFATMLKREPGSSVLLMNLPHPPKSPSARDVAVLFHELAHDIHYEAVLQNKKLPVSLKELQLLTEANSILFESQTRTPEWLMSFGVSRKEANEIIQQVKLRQYVEELVFLRFACVMHAFEARFYADPSQDIGYLWWECKERYQFLKRPQGWKNPDALAKYHIPNVPPLYYPYYAIGHIANAEFAELFSRRIDQDPQTASYYHQKELGTWLMTDFLAQGQLYRWDEYLEKTTGHSLSLDAWERCYLQSHVEEQLFPL